MNPLTVQVDPSSLSQEIVNLLKCGICWEYYNLPTVLPCGHTFCLKCIQEIGKHKVNNLHPSKVGNDVAIDCPNCRQKVSLSDIQRMKNGVHVNYVLSSIVETVIQARGSASKVDAGTNTDTEASNDNRVNEIEKSLKEIFKVVNKRKSVVNDAQNEIDELRSKAYRRKMVEENIKRQNLQQQAQSQDDINRNQGTWASRLFLPQRYPSQQANGYASNYADDLSNVDPAILSVRTTGTDQMVKGQLPPLSML